MSTTKSKMKTAKKQGENVKKQRITITKDIKEKAFYYYAKGLTCKEVAKLLDLSFRTVQNWQTSEKWTEKLNPDSLKEKCYTLNRKGQSYKNIAEMFKISISTVQRYIKEIKDRNKAINLE